MKRVFIILLLLASACHKKPPFRPDLAQVSSIQAEKLPYFRGTIMDPVWPEKKLSDDFHRFRSAGLTDETGKEVAATGKKPVLVYFFFASCSGICPAITMNVSYIRKKLPVPVRILAISIDPDHDVPRELTRFRGKFGITDPEWQFVRGEKKTVWKLAREVFQADVKTVSVRSMTEFVHTENVYLLDHDGYLRGIYRARGTGDLERLVQELNQLAQNG